MKGRNLFSVSGVSVIRVLDECHGRWGRDRFYGGLLALCLCLGLGLFLVPGLPAGDDIYFHLYRMEHLARAFRLGQFSLPVYSEAFDGYGYGVSLFYGDLFLYPPALLRAVGLPLILSVKVYVLILILTMGGGCYLCAWRMSRSCFAGFAAGLLTCWSSYVATDLFNRFAFGEFLAFVLMPLALWGYWEIQEGKSERWWLLSLGFAGLLLAHNLSFMMGGLLFGLLFLLQLKQWLREPHRLGRLMLSAMVCMLLTAFFWCGMLEQLLSQHLTLMEVSQGDISWRAMRWWSWVLAVPDLENTGAGHVWCPPGVGLLPVMLAAWHLCRRFRRHATSHTEDLLVLLGIVCCLLSTELAPWKSVLSHCFLSSMQFPWRFLQGATCFLGIGCGVVLGRRLGGNWRCERRWLGILVLWCGMVWGVNVGTAYWRGWNMTGMAQGAAELRSLEVGVMHYFPAGLTEDMVYARGEQVEVTGDLKDVMMERLPRGTVRCAFGGGGGVLELPLVYYPGYEARLDPEGRRLEVFNGGKGLVAVRIPETGSRGVVNIRYEGTVIQHISALVSLLTLLALIAWVLRKHA